MEDFIYQRTQLAETYCKGLFEGGLQNYRSGLFLAAPRRTGKNTFLRGDLLPVLEKHGFVTIYVDLWADREADPAVLISGAIQKKLNVFAGPVSRLAKKTGAERITLAGVISLKLNISPVLPDGVTLSEALAVLSEAAEKPVVLVVDEAQHALSTEKGSNTMFALKSARDTLNLAGQPLKLALVFTGSNRDKLANLTLDHKQPFYGVQIQRFPMLDKDFAREFVKHYSQELTGPKKLDVEAVYQAFSTLGFKPERLGNAARTAVHTFMKTSGKDLNQLLIEAAKEIQTKEDEHMRERLLDLNPLQRAVFEVLVRHHADFAPYKDSTLAEYKKILGKTVEKNSVQSALEALRKKGLVWKESFGGYVLEDENYVTLFGLNNKAFGFWD